MRIIQATTATDIDAARRLFAEYARSLDIDLDFQGFAAELAALPGDYVPVHGALLLALDGHDALGCVALRPLEPPRIAELKRLYVVPSGRGRGVGLSLARTAIEAAREGGYERVRLDTLPSMGPALRLYERLGFRDIHAYRYNPIETARYLELRL